MEWFIQIGTEPKGPFGTEEVLNKLSSGEINHDCLAFADGQADWTEIGKIPQFQQSQPDQLEPTTEQESSPPMAEMDLPPIMGQEPPKSESGQPEPRTEQASSSPMAELDSPTTLGREPTKPEPIMETESSPPTLATESSTGAETAQNIQVLETRQGNQTKAEIIAFTKLAGGDDLTVAKDIHDAYRSGLRLKQVRVDITNGELVIESGCLHYMRGSLEVEATSGGVGGWLKSAATGESTVKPRYKGSGLVHLEPTFGHFLFLDLKGEQWIVDQGMFYASEGSVEVGAVMQKNISSALFGGEGLFQTNLKGTGWAILSSPVPPDEIVKIQLNNDTLQVDGNFALARRGNIDFSVEKSAKSLWQSFRGGEGLLQTFRGTGEVWLAPTESIYASLKESAGLGDLTDSEGSSGSKSAGSKVLGLLGD